jgi:uncharacterized Zn-finger protein
MDNQIDMFSIINIKNENPDRAIPKGVKLKDKQKWCPYCSKPVIFVKDKEHGVKRCPYCNISHKDYYVKMVNNNWV